MKTEEIKTAYSVEQMMEILPATITLNKKKIFFTSECFELSVKKGEVFGTWCVEYYNERTVKFIYQVQKKTLPDALAEMISMLIEDKYLKL